MAILGAIAAIAGCMVWVVIMICKVLYTVNSKPRAVGSTVDETDDSSHRFGNPDPMWRRAHGVPLAYWKGDEGP